MRIGLVAPPWLPVPPPRYGGTESVVANLAQGLHRRGHDVRLFTVGESTCQVPTMSWYPKACSPMGLTVPEAVHVLAAYDALRDVDVVHDHTLLGPLLAGRRRLAGAPVVVTHHGLFDREARALFARIVATATVVAISRDQAARARPVRVDAVVHHGVDLVRLRPAEQVGDHLVFLGRMSPDKGPHHALRIAHAAGRPLRLVTKMREPEELTFYHDTVAPMISGDDELVVEPHFEEKLRLLASATALLNPIDWPEPFGLAMAEALACGTPVVATPCGAAPEIVRDGHNGFLRRGDEASALALAHIGEIDRAACRADAEARFSVARMVGDYERIYEMVAEAPSRTRRVPPAYASRATA